jgi:hypothetical protein
VLKIEKKNSGAKWLTKWNKYLHNETNETEENINIIVNMAVKSSKKKITCSTYDSTNSWRDNVFSRNDVSKEENDKIK